ncbi:MAG: sulfite exporter TauE/SafE family protein [Nitrosomonas sp.]|nr:sulfite exporter TauE/SafE family protein [Nitrosomonas sp.]
MTITLVSIVLGALTGLVLALTGAGGTIIAVPLLIFGLHFTVAQAAPVALLAVSLSAGIGALIAHRQRLVRYRAAGFIAVTGIITAPLGIWGAQHLPNTPLTMLFAAVLFFVAIRMLLRGEAPNQPPHTSAEQPCESVSVPCRLEYDQGRLVWNWPCARILALFGATTGFLSGLLGVGGGFVVVPALRKATNLPMQSILATSLAVIALVSAMGVITASSLGGMNWPVALPFAAGALGGMLTGRLFARRLEGPRLQQGFAVIAILVALGMAGKAILSLI